MNVLGKEASLGVGISLGLGVALLLAGFAVVRNQLGLLGDGIALTLFLIAVLEIYRRLGASGAAFAATTFIGSLVYYVLSQVTISDVNIYFETGNRLINSQSATVRYGSSSILGTDFMIYLSFYIQNWLPVSILGLGWIFLTVKVALGASMAFFAYRRPTFFWLLASSPIIIVFTGLYSKDLLSLIAVFVSLVAFSEHKRGRTVYWILWLVVAAAIELPVRPYMIPVILGPHVVMMLLSSLRTLRRSRLQRIPVSAALMLPLAVAGIAVVAPLIQQYIGVTELSDIGERLNRVSNDMNGGTTALQLSVPEKIGLIVAPLPYRTLRFNIFFQMLSLFSLIYFIMFFYAIFRLYRFRRFRQVDHEIALFCVLAIVIWTFAYWGISNMGALERLKAQVLPFLFLLITELLAASRRTAGPEVTALPGSPA